MSFKDLDLNMSPLIARGSERYKFMPHMKPLCLLAVSEELPIWQMLQFI